MTEKLNIGDRLKALRERLHWSQGDMAGELSVDRSYLSQIENGKKEPSPRFVERVDLLERVGPIKMRGASYLFDNSLAQDVPQSPILREDSAPYMTHALNTVEGLKKNIQEQSAALQTAGPEHSLIITSALRRMLDLLDKKLEEQA